jgi:hypothetical protein
MSEKGVGGARRKVEVAVTMSLAHDELFSGAVFLDADERLIDLLNDDRAFIPVRRVDGATVIVAKSNIVSIVENVVAADEAGQNSSSGSTEARDGDSDHEKPEPDRPRRAAFDPYKVLRITPDATIEEVRRAYKARIKAVHPDTLFGLELDDDIQKAAMTAAQRVNFAYNKILKDRRASAEDDDATANVA